MSSRKFTLSTCLSSHVSVTKSLPGIILAPLLLSPPSVELVHLTMNSLISCPYCTDLHTNLGRMAGREGSEKINECGGELKTIEKLVGDDEVHVGISKYALEFGTSGGPPNTKAGKGGCWSEAMGTYRHHYNCLRMPSSPCSLRSLPSPQTSSPPLVPPLALTQ